MRMEALGLVSVGDNKEALEQRLLKSVSDLKLLRDERIRSPSGWWLFQKPFSFT